MAERLKAPLSKSGKGATSSWVRIPLSPPKTSKTDGCTQNLILAIIIKFPLALRAIGARFFLSAGTINYWQGWFYLFLIGTDVGGNLRFYQADRNCSGRG